MSDDKTIKRPANFFNRLANSPYVEPLEVASKTSSRKRRKPASTVSIYITDSTKRLIQAEAKNANLSMCEFVRRLIDRRHDNRGANDVRKTLVRTLGRLDQLESRLDAIEDQLTRMGDLMLLSLQYAMFTADDHVESDPHLAKAHAVEQLTTSVRLVQQKADAGMSIWSQYFGEDSS